MERISLDAVRTALAAPAPRSTPIWALLLAAVLAAAAGVSTAGMVIFGPGAPAVEGGVLKP